MGQQVGKIFSNGTRKKFLYTSNFSVSLRLFQIFLKRNEIFWFKINKCLQYMEPRLFGEKAESRTGAGNAQNELAASYTARK